MDLHSGSGPMLILRSLIRPRYWHTTITHGLWSWDYKKPHRLTAYSFRRNVEFLAPLDADRIWQLGDKIGEVNFLFVYPGGKQHAYKALSKDLQRRSSFVSRSWLLSLQDRSRKSR